MACRGDFYSILISVLPILLAMPPVGRRAFVMHCEIKADPAMRISLKLAWPTPPLIFSFGSR